MAMEGREVILAAAQAALDQARTPRRRSPRLPAGRAMLLGAGAVTAWRLVARSRGRQVLGALEDRLLEYEERHFGIGEPGLDGHEDEELVDSVAEEPEEEPEAEEPEAEEPEEEPEAEESEDEEPEEDDADEDEDADEEEIADEEP